ncbi:MAG: N-acetylneuraminate synthase family protein [Patulibacter sp.]
MTTLHIAGRPIGAGAPPYFIADIGANHDGDFQRALTLIDQAAEAGADAVKFQNFTASSIVSRRGFDELGGQLAHQAAWDKPVYEVYEDASLPIDWTAALAERASAAGVHYFTSPYDLDAIAAVEPYVPAFKVGSGDITWPAVIERMGRSGKPVLLAAGASTQRDVDRALNVVRGVSDQVVLMQCNTNYTGSNENFGYLNLGVLRDWSVRYPGIVLGLSDHTPGHISVVAALALGATVFEKHFTDDPSRPGPDHRFAMTPQTWRAMVEAATLAAASIGDGVKRIEANERDASVVQRRALRFAADFPAGHVVSAHDLFPTRPCPPEGLEPYREAEVVGRQLLAPVQADALVTLKNLA